MLRNSVAIEKKGVTVFEVARVLVRFDHVARFIVNANYSIICYTMERQKSFRGPLFLRCLKVYDECHIGS
jgi:hypothetical protein